MSDSVVLLTHLTVANTNAQVRTKTSAAVEVIEDVRHQAPNIGAARLLILKIPLIVAIGQFDVRAEAAVPGVASGGVTQKAVVVISVLQLRIEALPDIAAHIPAFSRV